jgi:phosphonate transport system permease protein
MPVSSASGRPQWSRRTSAGQLLAWFCWLALAAVTIAAWRLMTQDTIWDFVLSAPAQAADIGGRMFPPRWSYLEKLWWPMWETLNIATIGTLLAMLLGIPLAFLAARNTTPSFYIVRPLALLVIVASRSINGLIWGLLLVSIIGPGPLAGTIAIMFRSLGFIGKLLYEAIEEIDQSQVEATIAAGGSPLQVIDYGIVPQILPAVAGISVYRWDINIRESAILGLVGAGGIGLQLDASLATLAWPQVTMILIAILGAVLLSEWVSARIRHAII